jgi:hypothetical protein
MTMERDEICAWVHNGMIIYNGEIGPPAIVFIPWSADMSVEDRSVATAAAYVAFQLLNPKTEWIERGLFIYFYARVCITPAA